MLNRRDLTFDAARAESGRDKNAVDAFQESGDILLRHRFRIDPLHIHATVIDRTGVNERLADTLIRVLVGDIFTDESHRDGGLRTLHAMDETGPCLQVLRTGFHAELLQDDLIEIPSTEQERHLVDGFCINGLDHRFFRHITEQSDLAPHLAGQFLFGPAEKDIGYDAELHQLFHGVLRGFRLELAGTADVRYVRKMDVDAVAATALQLDLPGGLDVRLRLDIAHRTADLDDDEVEGLIEVRHATLDFVRDVWYHLNRLAQVLTTPFLLDDLEIHLTRRGIVLPGHRYIKEALVVTQVEVGFRSVIRYIHLTVLKRIHGAGIDVDIRIELLDRDAVAA